MEIEGRVLLFDNINKNGVEFSKTCEFIIPDEIPLLFEFDRYKVIGIAEATVDDKGIFVKAKTFQPPNCDALLISELLKNEKIGAGGYYTGIKFIKDKSTIVVDEATLQSVSITTSPAQKECFFEIIKEKEE